MDFDDIHAVIVEEVQNGYGRFEGVHHARMDEKGRFQCPKEWIDFLYQEDWNSKFDQLANILVFEYSSSPWTRKLQTEYL